MKTKLNICFISHSYLKNKNDTSNAPHSIAKALVKHGCRVWALVHKIGPMKSREIIDKVNIIRHPSISKIAYGKATNQGLNKSLNFIFIVTEFISFFLSLIYLIVLSVKKKIDIIHAHWVIPSGLIAVFAGKLLNIPTVITAHGRDVYYLPEAGYTIPGNPLLKTLLKLTLKYCDQIIANSKNCMHQIKKISRDSNNITIIYNGGDIDIFKPNSNSQEILSNIINIKKHTIILTARPLRLIKGIHILINSIKILISEFPDLFLIIAGEGPYKSNLKTLAAKLNLNDHILFTGNLSPNTLNHYYNICDIFVIPSLEEAFGIVSVEAMACKKPVIGTDAGGIPEVIENNKTGLIVKKGDAKQLADAIEYLIVNKKKATNLAENGYLKTQNYWNWGRAAQEYYAEYKKLVLSK